MMGKVIGIVIVVSALVAGGALYYLQVYHFYERIEATGASDVVLTVDGGAPEPLEHADFTAIDAISSPIRYRACFTTPLSQEVLAERYASYARAEPRNAPRWFDCFDAAELGAALRDGQARAYLGQANVVYGIDRVVAITPDGRGYVWHQINPCGAAAFDGNPVPQGCPPPPSDT